MTVHCKTCNHEWQLDTSTSFILHAIQAMKSAAMDGCPVCGATGSTVLEGAARKVHRRRSSRDKEIA